MGNRPLKPNWWRCYCLRVMFRKLGFPEAETGWPQILIRSLEPQRAGGSPVANASRFLFLQYETALGAAIHASPVYEALRRAVPDAHVTVFCSGLPYDVLKYNPHIDRIIHTPHPLKHWNQALCFFARRFLRTRILYDCVVTNSGHRRLRFALLSFLTGVRTRIGFEFPRSLNHLSIAYDSEKSILENNLRLISALGHTYSHTEPAVFFSQREVDQAERLLTELGISQERALVAFQTQTSGGEPNQWYDHRFSLLAEQFYDSTKAQILFVGTKPEGHRIEAIRAGMHGPSYSAAGRTDVSTLAALLAHCDLLITLDTGTMHVGRAVRVPMVIIAPAKNPEHEWLPPVNEHIRVLIRREIACARCGKTYCPTRECMDEIRVHTVLSAAMDQLAKFPPSPSARRERVSRWTRT